MKWAHGKILDKLQDLATPFEIKIMLVDPAFSSRFDSRTGVAGIRVNEVARGFDREMPYAAWKKRLNKGGKTADVADRVNKLVKIFDDHPDYKGTLLLPVEGGKLFFAARADQGEGHQNADENAAINIGRRAIAHPDRLEIFPRLRTTRVNSSAVRVTHRRGSFALAKCEIDRQLVKSGTETEAVRILEPSSTSEDEGSEESSERPDFFVVSDDTGFPGLPEAESYVLPRGSAMRLPKFSAYARPLFLRKVQEVSFQRVEEVNHARLARVNSKANEGQVEEDNVPMSDGQK
jgi:hypothetical protein